MKLPPLNAVRAFESAARNQSFLLAANELFVSAASISRFIKILESELGFILFTRKSSGVKLTEKGSDYYLSLHPLLNEISKITEQAKAKEQKKVIQITSIPAIAETWLVSKLWDFQKKYKDIEINLSLDDKDIDFVSGKTDIWLTFSEEEYKNCKCFTLQDNRLILVSNPKIAKNIINPEDVFKFPLLYDLDWANDWQEWLKKANLLDCNQQRDGFERYSMVINAAIAGSGIAVGRTALIQSYLDTGVLVQVSDVVVRTKQQFYAVISNDNNSDNVNKFIKWFSS